MDSLTFIFIDHKHSANDHLLGSTTKHYYTSLLYWTYQKHRLIYPLVTITTKQLLYEMLCLNSLSMSLRVD